MNNVEAYTRLHIMWNKYKFLEQSMHNGSRRSPEAKKTAILQAPLIEMISLKLAKDNVSVRTFAENHGLSYSMLNSVMNSTRWVAHSDKQTVVEPLARLLGIPVVSVYIKSGLLTHQDFILEETLEKRLEDGYEAMMKDQTLLALLPSKEEFDKLPITAQSAIVLLWQTYSKQELLDMVVIDKPIIVESTSVAPKLEPQKIAAAKKAVAKKKKPNLKKPKPLSIKKVARWRDK